MYIQVKNHSTGTWESANSHTYGTRFYKTHLHSSSNSSALPTPHMGQTHPYNNVGAHATSFGKYCPTRKCLPFLPYCAIITPAHPKPKHPNSLHPNCSDTTFGKYTLFYLCSLIFSLWPMKWPQYGGSESFNKQIDCFVSALRRYHIMKANMVSKLNYLWMWLKT